MLLKGDNLGQWIQRQQRNWSELSKEQQRRLTTLGIRPAERPSPAPAAKASAAFHRGITALARYIARAGTSTPVPRGHSETITVDDQTEAITVRLGVWITNTKTRRHTLTQAQLDARRAISWALADDVGHHVAVWKLQKPMSPRTPLPRHFTITDHSVAQQRPAGTVPIQQPTCTA
ncbi:helicase associated domain-containing protein [Streptomyces sp. NPDC001999]